MKCVGVGIEGNDGLCGGRRRWDLLPPGRSSPREQETDGGAIERKGWRVGGHRQWIERQRLP